MENYSFLIIIICILLLLFFILRKKAHEYSRSKRRFGNHPICPEEQGKTYEESVVRLLLRNGIPECTIFHDLYIRKPNGNYSQTDIVVVTTAGIIVIEVKDYSGWIFGNGQQKYWTQVLAYGKEKHRFYNPIMQNQGHIAALRGLSKQFQKLPYYSVILFNGDCVLRDISDVPNNTCVIKSRSLIEVINTIKSNSPAPYTDKHEIICLLQNCVLAGKNPAVRSEHISQIHQRFQLS